MSTSWKLPLIGSWSTQTTVQKETVAQVQYGLKGLIMNCRVHIDEQHFKITELEDSESKMNESNVCMKWSQLLNIDDLQSNNQLHSLQLLFQDKDHPSIYIYFDSKSQKTQWLKVLIKLCPRFVLTKELQTVKSHASSVGFTESQIEDALIQYHQQWGTVYNIHVFVNLMVQQDDDKQADNDDAESEEDVTCAICKLVYTHPARNIHGKTYCYECIRRWFDQITEETTSIREPLTQQPLPQHCRFLFPDFAKMAQAWNHRHRHKAKDCMSNSTMLQLQSVDEEMDKRRKKILNYLQSTEDCEQIANKLLPRLMKSDTFSLDEKSLDEVLSDALQCYRWFAEIRTLIEKGSKVYNDAIMRIVDNHKQKGCLFEWKPAEWNSFIDKNARNWGEIYQVDELLLSETDMHVHGCVESISKIMQNQQLSVSEMKEQILKIVLQKQQEIVASYSKQDEEAQEEEKQSQISNDPKKPRPIQMERIFYTEKHGLVNTRCVREIAECMQNGKAFELYHNDLQHKSMNREHLVRFLQTAGLNGIEQQHYIYEGFAMFIKDKLLRLSAYLKTLPQKPQQTKFPYFKFVKNVDIVKQPVMDQKDWKQENDKVELRVKLDVDYDEHLAKYNGDKQALGEEIKRQMLKQLKLNSAVKARECMLVRDVKKGCIDFRLLILVPLISIVYGGVDFVSCYNAHYQDPKFYISTKRSVFQGMAVGGGIGMIAGGACVVAGVAAALSPISLVVGCAVAGAVVGGLIGYGFWKLLKHLKRQNVGPGYEHEDDGGDDANGNEHEEADDDEADEDKDGDGTGDDAIIAIANEPINRPGGQVPASRVNEVARRGQGEASWIMESQVNIGDISGRVWNNGNAWMIRLNCNCEVEYGRLRNEGGYQHCAKHNVTTCTNAMERYIESGANGNAGGDIRNCAVHRVFCRPQQPEQEFDLESGSDDDRGY